MTNRFIHFDEYEEHDTEPSLAQMAIRSRKTMIELLKDREYEDITPLYPSDQPQPGGRDLHLLATSSRTNKQMIVYWGVDLKFGVQDIRSLLVILNDRAVDHAILVTNHRISSKIQKILHDEAKKGVRIELFTVDELQLNCSKHSMVPKHQVLTREQTRELLDTYQLKFTSQLPKIRTGDSIVRYYGFRRNQVVRILRQDGDVHYRVVW